MRLMAAPSTECAGFLHELRERGGAPDPVVEAAVRDILADVRANGDAAVLAHTARLDGVRLDAQTMRVSDAECDAAVASLDPGVREALALAAERIAAFHTRQRRESWFVEEPGVGVLGPIGAAPPSSRPVRAGRLGGLSVLGSHERHSRQGGRGGRGRHVHAGTEGAQRAASRPGRGPTGRRPGDLPDRRRPGHRCHGVRHGHHPPGGQDRGSREHLRGDGQAAGLRGRRHRHAGRAQRGGGDRRRGGPGRLGRGGPPGPGRARPHGLGHLHHTAGGGGRCGPGGGGAAAGSACPAAPLRSRP